MFESVLIPNRGEIAVRVIRACRDLGVRTIVAASSVDATRSLPAMVADQVVEIGGPRANDSYLNISAILDAAASVRAEAIHPGYGFLSENPTLAQACRDRGVAFIGPSARVVAKAGNKTEARETARQAGVPILPGMSLPEPMTDQAERVLTDEIGYPLLIKAVHGGGGRGMRLVEGPNDLAASISIASKEAAAAFGSAALYAEHYVLRARHVEVQIAGLSDGSVVALGDRDCSVQRRHQKLVEEAPAPTLTEELRSRLHDSARRIGREFEYENVGTVEFLVDDVTAEYFFLEVNSRLQVEHPVTEAVTGIDIVRTQLEIASGSPVGRQVRDEPIHRGCAIECRINAEDPARKFRPSPGQVELWYPPTMGCTRVDTHCYAGYVVPPYYDSLLAKVIAAGTTREEAIDNMVEALRNFTVTGIDTTIEWSRDIVSSREFRSSEVYTCWVDELLQAQGSFPETIVE